MNKYKYIAAGISIAIHVVLLVVLSLVTLGFCSSYDFKKTDQAKTLEEEEEIPLLLDEELIEELKIGEEFAEDETGSSMDDSESNPEEEGMETSGGADMDAELDLTDAEENTTDLPSAVHEQSTVQSKTSSAKEPDAKPSSANARRDTKDQTNKTNTQSQLSQKDKPAPTQNDNHKAKEEAKQAAAKEAQRQAAEQQRLKEEQARKAKEAEEARRRAAEKAAEEKARAEKEAADKAKRDAAHQTSSSRASGFNNGQKNNGNGGNNGSVEGSGAGNVGTGYQVGNRKAISLPKPAYADRSSAGSVIVSIVVDKAGNVKSATISSPGGTSPTLQNAALRAAKQAKFSASENDNEKGSITYNFKQK